MARKPMKRHLPNIITALRLAALPAAAWALLQGDRPLTLGIVGLIAFSDWLDGFLARRWQVSSKLGTILDPLADKLAQLTLLVLLAFGGRAEFGSIPGWFAGLILAREIWLVYGALRIRFHKGSVEIKARWEGKLSTVLVFMLLFVALLNGPQLWIDVLCWCTAPLIIVSAVQYYRAGLAQVR
ncbi:MAG: CDP-alcohol phosphatidyltransferase family protein [Planctomycetota bacterium]